MPSKFPCCSLLFYRKFLLILLVLPHTVGALDTINQILLDHAKTYPRTDDTELMTLVPQLISPANTEAEKAEVLFYWISQNIVYDVSGLLSGDYITTVQETIRQGKGICHNYAKLYQEMCRLAGLECHYIGGYAKGYSYDPKQAFKEINHAWNAVKIDTAYLFVDATWGSGTVGVAAGKMTYTLRLNVKQVLEGPGAFSAKHLPGNPVWQLVERPISLQRFQAYETFEEMQLQEIPPISYLDSLNQFLSLDTQWRKVITAHQTYRFNPTEENTWWLGSAYWGYGDHLSEGGYNATRLRKSLSSYLSAIACFKTIKMRYEAAQQEIEKIRHNIKQVRSRLEYKY
jgi:hypothetical protein